MQFLNKDIDKYITDHTNQEPKLLSDLNRETWTKMINPRMLSGHLQGRVLSIISHMICPDRILEVGTYTGYSALCLAEGLSKNGKIHTIDINNEYLHFSAKYFNQSKYKDKIIQHKGNAIDIIPTINEKIQLAFIDADKENYCNYYKLIIEQLDVGGYIIADNVLWSGKIINKEKDHETQSIDNYNKLVHKDKRVENVLFPIRDGLMICKKVSH